MRLEQGIMVAKYKRCWLSLAQNMLVFVSSKGIDFHWLALCLVTKTNLMYNKSRYFTFLQSLVIVFIGPFLCGGAL